MLGTVEELLYVVYIGHVSLRVGSELSERILMYLVVLGVR